MMRFERNSKKNRINRAKHNGLDFETAAGVFDDPNVVLMHDRVGGGEQRWHDREDHANGEAIIRIISAREADQRERRIYLQQAAQ